MKLTNDRINRLSCLFHSSIFALSLIAVNGENLDEFHHITVCTINNTITVLHGNSGILHAMIACISNSAIPSIHAQQVCNTSSEIISTRIFTKRLHRTGQSHIQRSIRGKINLSLIILILTVIDFSHDTGLGNDNNIITGLFFALGEFFLLMVYKR